MAASAAQSTFARNFKGGLPDRPAAFGMSSNAQQRESQRIDRERERLEKERLEREGQEQLEQLTQEQREEIDEAVSCARRIPLLLVL